MTPPLPEPLMINGEPHYSAGQIAEMQLPGLPGSREGVCRKAARESWIRCSRPSGRGGGKVYPFKALPRETQAKMREKDILLVLGADQRVRVKTKVVAVHLWRRYRRHASKEVSIGNARKAFCRLAGRAGAEDRAYKALPSFAASSLHRWDRALEKGGLRALAGQRSQPHEGRCVPGADTKMRETLLGMLADSLPVLERFLELSAGREHEIASVLLKAAHLAIKSQEES